MDYVSLVRDTVKSVRINSPILLIQDAVVIFKKLFSVPIKTVETNEDVRDLVSYYYGINALSHLLVIEDLSLLSDEGSFLLLKLVEEAKFPIVLLSSYDKVSPILLSRCKRILKFSITNINSMFLPAFRGKEIMDEYLAEGSNIMDRYRWMRDNSPMLYKYYKILEGNVNIDKILNILM